MELPPLKPIGQGVYKNAPKYNWVNNAANEEVWEVNLNKMNANSLRGTDEIYANTKEPVKYQSLANKRNMSWANYNQRKSQKRSRSNSMNNLYNAPSTKTNASNPKNIRSLTPNENYVYSKPRSRKNRKSRKSRRAQRRN